MENIHSMLQELYKAISGKVVMENAAAFAALKKWEYKHKELEGLRKEVRSTWARKILAILCLKNKFVQVITNETPMNTSESSKTSEKKNRRKQATNHYKKNKSLLSPQYSQLSLKYQLWHQSLRQMRHKLARLWIGTSYFVTDPRIKTRRICEQG